MNIEKHLILIKDEDKTDKVTYCKYGEGKYEVTFDNNKTYFYNFNNIKWLKNPIEFNPETAIIYENNQPISGVVKILKFEDYIRVFFKTGYKKLYHKSDIVIEETCLKNPQANNCFHYLKKLAANLGVTIENDNSFLSKQYGKVTTISPRSVLADYLSKKELKPRSHTEQIIFPFGFNLSQKKATEKALTNQISVIEGPPGTGKTQSILNIIANAIINNKTVAVVSNNNSATANVMEKLDKYGLEFIAAYLGNKENREEFFQFQETFAYPDMSNWIIEAEELGKIKEKLKNSQEELDDMLGKQNKLAKLKQELSEHSIEAEYFSQYYQKENIKSISYKSFFPKTSSNVMSLLLDINLTLVEQETFRLRNKLKNLFSHGIYSFKFYKNSTEDIVEYLNKLYYDQRLIELKEEIKSLSRTLEKYNFKTSMKEYSEDSMKLFKHSLGEKYKKNNRRPQFTKDDLWKNFDSFIKEYPVILSTTHSLRSCASQNFLFDYVIIDEASQVDIVTGALAFSSAKNAVVVGDLKQLPNVVTSEVQSKTDMIFKEYNLHEAYNYADNSLLSSITKLYEDIPKTLLKEHYRCHPKVIDFCNKKFYNNELIILTNEEEQDKPLLLYNTMKGNHARGNFNQRQIDVIVEEVIPQLKAEEKNKSIGIISPYRMQVEELKKVIGSKNIEVDTVHKYQGREKEIVILTTVANEINDFIDDPNLINVAVSRAESKLILVATDNNELKENSNIGDLVKYIKYNNFEVINSNISSVFDLLYSSYSDKLLELMSKSRKVSKYTSENLMNIVIEKILKEEEFSTLDRVLHQPLKMLIRDKSKLSEVEYKFAMNPLTHTDFVIFNKIDKMPVLVVEVDGYAFHVKNEKQKQRDIMKDEILRKYDIPFLRFSTNESGEELKLRSKLCELLNI